MVSKNDIKQVNVDTIRQLDSWDKAHVMRKYAEWRAEQRIKERKEGKLRANRIYNLLNPEAVKRAKQKYNKKMKQKKILLNELKL